MMTPLKKQASKIIMNLSLSIKVWSMKAAVSVVDDPPELFEADVSARVGKRHGGIVAAILAGEPYPTGGDSAHSPHACMSSLREKQQCLPTPAVSTMTPCLRLRRR